MKKSGKVMLLIALCCIAGGLILTGVCAAYAIAGGISLADQLPSGLRPNNAEASGGAVREGEGAQRVELGSVTSLSLALVDEPVTIKIGGDRVVLEWSQEYAGQYRYTADEGGRLALYRDDVSFGLGNFGWHIGSNLFHFDVSGLLRFLDGSLWNGWRNGREGGAVTVTLPEGTRLGDLHIGNVSGRVTLSGISADRLTVDSVSSPLTAADGRFDRVSVNSTSGRADFENCSLGALDMDTVSGGLTVRNGSLREVTLDGVNAELTLDRAAGLERVRVDGVNATGNITLTGSASQYRLEAEGLNASIDADGQWGRDTRNAGAPYSIRVSGVNATLHVRSGG